MRGLSVRRVASTALCATLALGIAAPAALAADAVPGGHRAASRAPAPDADGVLDQVAGLGDLGALLKPVTDLLGNLLGTGSGQLGADDAADLTGTVQDALAEVQANLPSATNVASTVTTTPSTAATPSTPATPAAPATTASGHADAALADLQKAVDALVKATSSADNTQVGPATNGLVTGVVNLVNATLADSGLSTSGITGLTDVPAVSTLPAPLTATPAPSAS
ncbi:hypothetical protein AB0E88_03575 [Streptomyces sp. NPDC028635]|uniref:hypothetical protein n=1 Tax=Streptomyces sp. NPDC028635 TaxID=3154800 RepID=UPI0033CC7D63